MHRHITHIPLPPHVREARERLEAGRETLLPARALLLAGHHRLHLRGLSAMRASLSAAAWAVVLLGALGSVFPASDDAGFSPPLAAPAPAAAPPRPAPRADDAVLPRKMLRPGDTDVDVGGGVRPHRVDEGCAGAEDIAIYQGRATTLPSGVPAYTVDVMNRCAGGGGCAIADIHVRCGWFSSVSLVDPRKFRRLGRDDCLLNDGRPLLAGDTVSFEYSNSFPYKLSVAVATCVDPTSP